MPSLWFLTLVVSTLCRWLAMPRCHKSTRSNQNSDSSADLWPRLWWTHEWFVLVIPFLLSKISVLLLWLNIVQTSRRCFRYKFCIILYYLLNPWAAIGQREDPLHLLVLFFLLVLNCWKACPKRNPQLFQLSQWPPDYRKYRKPEPSSV